MFRAKGFFDEANIRALFAAPITAHPSPHAEVPLLSPRLLPQLCSP
jgi:hypothetical protein